MCGRYTLIIDKSTIEKRFCAKFYIAQASYNWAPIYNAAPSQMLPTSAPTPQTASSSRAGAFGRRSGSAQNAATR
jgi:putative SOS response-associated peptidase YedK